MEWKNPTRKCQIEIRDGGKDNLMYMRDLNQLLVEIQYLLEYKNQFEDLSEKEDDVIEKGQHLIEIILGMS